MTHRLKWWFGEVLSRVAGYLIHWGIALEQRAHEIHPRGVYISLGRDGEPDRWVKTGEVHRDPPLLEGL